MLTIGNNVKVVLEVVIIVVLMVVPVDFISHIVHCTATWANEGNARLLDHLHELGILREETIPSSNQGSCNYGNGCGDDSSGTGRGGGVMMD